MKKNGEFVGVDEKFIPENEKYVDESLLGDKEKAKKTAKKFAKGYLIFFVIFMVFAISMPIFMFMHGRKQMNDMRDKFNSGYNSSGTKGNMYTFNHLSGDKWGSELRDYLDKIITNNKLDGYAHITVVYNGKSAITPDEILTIKNEISNTNSEDYEVSVDYADSLGQVVNKVTIKDIK